MTVAAAERVHSPYVGLAPFGEDGAAFFFGRERERRVVVANLLTARLTLLYGQSGVGKSSLLNAGVIYHLRNDPELHEHATPPLVVRQRDWQGDPIVAVTSALADAAPGAGVVPSVGSGALGAALASVEGSTPGDVLLILDQFEEFFVYRRHDGAADAFARELGRVLRDADLRTNVLIAMREDSLADLDRFKGAVPALFENRIRLDPLSTDAAREAVLRPPQVYAERTGTEVELEPELVRTVVEDVRYGRLHFGEAGRGAVETADADAIDAPYLQLVMMRLWETDARSGRLTTTTYRKLGGAQAIVREHLDAALGTLTIDERRTAAAMFDRLVTPSGSKIAHRVTDLAEYADVDEHVVLEVVAKLTGKERILRAVPTPGAGPGAQRYEIYHDALAPAVLDWRSRFLKDVHERELVHEVQQRPDAVSFPELVWAHFEYERELQEQGHVSTRTELRYHETRAVFEAAEGPITNEYWAARSPSAVAITVKPVRRLLRRDLVIRFHRETPWAAERADAADVLHECDVLATRVVEVLRGTSRRIALELVFSVASRVVADMDHGVETPYARDRYFDQLSTAQRYYRDGAERSGRLLYFYAMLWSLVVVAAAGFVAAVAAYAMLGGIAVVFHAIAAAVAGAVGGVVGAVMRMAGQLREFDYELGRRETRLIATSRPVIGAVFGVATFFALTSVFTLLHVSFGSQAEFFSIATLAFVAGFLERVATIVLAPARRASDALGPAAMD